ncbi:MAG: thioredoxin domain-containing protein, partial [Bryobacterales bacterium]|nr:thioredoxin domain-containing protein [Bryobacterales bacterium]
AERAFRFFQGEFDAEFGGFGGAPKFPRTVVHHFLLRYWARTGNAEAARMVFATLEAMARGGMCDQLGGGFHRYSVDERWFVPHFEKMLYDQALLAVSYLEAYQATGDQFHARVARSIFDYVLRDMIHPEGAFYSAEDADSAPDPDRPEVKSEGAFYLWRKSEIERLLGEQAAAPFCDLYGVREGGNVEFDPHGEFAGRNILYVAGSPGQAAELGDARRKLLEARSLRPRPHLDDKILTAWNALMISALARGAQVLGEPRLAEAARRAAGFVLSRLYDAPSGTLLRRFRDGDAAIGGFLDDYAFLAQALLDLYPTDFHPRWLEHALALTEKARELFEDPSNGGFFSAIAASDLVLRMKDDHDGAEPSANSIMVSNLLRLAEITGRDELRQSAERALEAFAGRLKAAPAALPQLLAACLRAGAHPRQVVIAGDRQSADTEALVAEVRRRFLPDTLLLVVDESSRATLARWNPTVAQMHPIEGNAAAYVCENFACREPVTEPGRLGKLLYSRA